MTSGLGNLGYIALERSDAPNATVLIEESLRLHREVDDVWGESTALLNLGAAYYRSGRMDVGREAFEAALRTTMRLGSMEYVAYALQGMAATISESEPRRSAELLGVSGRLLDDADAELEPIERELREAALSRVTALLGINVSDALAAGAQLETSDAVERALSRGLTRRHAAPRPPRLVSAAASARMEKRRGSRRSPATRPRRDQQVDGVGYPSSRVRAREEGGRSRRGRVHERALMDDGESMNCRLA